MYIFTKIFGIFSLILYGYFEKIKKMKKLKK